MYYLNDYNIVASYLWRKMQRDFASIIYDGTGMQIVACVFILIGLIIVCGYFLNRLLFQSKSVVNVVDNIRKIKKILKKCISQDKFIILEIDDRKVASDLKIFNVSNKDITLVSIDSKVNKLWIDKVATCYCKLIDSKGEIVYRFTATVLDIEDHEKKLVLAMPETMYFSRQ